MVKRTSSYRRAIIDSLVIRLINQVRFEREFAAPGDSFYHVTLGL